MNCNTDATTTACKQTIMELVGMGSSGLLKLKERLPLIFDSHRILTNEAKRRILRECSLQPILETTPVHEISFLLTPGDLAPTENPPRARRTNKTRRSNPSRG